MSQVAWWEAWTQRYIIERMQESEFRLKSWIKLNNARVIYQDGDSIFYSREGHAGRAEPSPAMAKPCV